MLKSISVHSYYRIFSSSGTSDKINIITTSLSKLFGYFDYPGTKGLRRLPLFLLIDGKTYCKIELNSRRYGLIAD